MLMPISEALWPVLQSTSPLPRHLQRLNRFTAPAGHLMQGYGYTRGLYDVMKVAQLARRTDLTPEQQQALDFETHLAIASLLSNTGIDITQYGLGKMGEQLARRAAKGLIPGSRLGQLGFTAGSKLARLGGPALGVLSAGFDIYSAIRSFSALVEETDPKKRQDLIVSGTLSVVGAAVAIGTGIAFMLGGPAAMLGGPGGLAIVASIMATGQLYSAVREVEEIKKYVDLTAWQELEAGWKAFWGLEQSVELHNKAAYQQTLTEVATEYHRLLEKEANQLLLANSHIDTLYYSREGVTLEEQVYQQLRGKEQEPKLSPGNVGGTHWSHDKVLEEKIKSEQAGNRRHYYSEVKFNGTGKRYSDLHLENSACAFYTPKGPEGTDDNIAINRHSEKVVRQEQVTGHRQRVGQFVYQQGKPLSADLNVLHRDYHAVMGDFNGDGHADIGYFSDQGFYLLSGEGKGRYDQAQLIDGIESKYCSIGGNFTNPQRLVRDVNKDGRDDIIIITPVDHKTDLRILLAQPEGGFTSLLQTLPLRLPDLSQAPPLLADVDGDGCADLVSFISNTVSTTLHVHYGLGDGLFSTTDDSLVLSYEQLYRLAGRSMKDDIHHLSGDIDGDGCEDVMSFTRSGQCYTLLGSKNREQPFRAIAVQSNATVASVFSEASGFNTAQLQLHDMNADGCADLVVVKHYGSYSIAYGRPDGTFDPEQPHTSEDKEKDEKGRRIVYRPNFLSIHGQQHILGITQGSDGGQVLLSLNQAGEVNAHSFQSTRLSDTTVMFRLGDGNDVAKGHLEQRNIFEVQRGKKEFTGGYCADTFLLMGRPVPDEPSVLDGGSAPLSGAPFDDNDRVIAMVKLAEGYGYHIDLKRGYVKYQQESVQDDEVDDQRIAKLHNIKHAQGHHEMPDTLVGDDRDNHLNGAGGQDSLFGHGGNDLLTLQVGYAAGGTGIDSYHILQNTGTEEEVSVRLQEEPNTHETSNILLDYTASQIERMEFNHEDVQITLLNDNRTRTALKLMNTYREIRKGHPWKRQNNYILYTRDGLMISGWPEELSQPRQQPFMDVYEPFPVPLLAVYNPDSDRTWTQRVKRGSENLIIRQDMSKGEMELEGESVDFFSDTTTLLPRFIKLSPSGTRFNDVLEGDEQDNVFTSSLGNDTFVGKGRVDHYIIDPKKAGQDILIDNEDDSDLENTWAQDRLIFPFPVQKIRLQQTRNDMVLGHVDKDLFPAEIRIKNFMLGERYRHLSLMDDSGKLYPFTLNHQNQPVLGEPVDATENNDVIKISHVSQVTDNHIASLAGDDVIIDKSEGDHRLSGGEGNDMLLVEQGNHTLIGGKGSDMIFGGSGDDTDEFERGDGWNIISDTGGNDRLIFTGISKEQLFFVKKEDDLQIFIKEEKIEREEGEEALAEAEEGVSIKGYYARPEQKMEAIEMAGNEILSEEIDQLLLTEVMSAFDALKKVTPERPPVFLPSTSEAAQMIPPL